MGSAWIYPFIVVGGVPRAAGAPMNARLATSPRNTWLASAIPSALVARVFVGSFAVMPRPRPTANGLETMPWWAPTGGLAGAGALCAGLVLAPKVGAGPDTGLTIAAALTA